MWGSLGGGLGCVREAGRLRNAIGSGVPQVSTGVHDPLGIRPQEAGPTLRREMGGRKINFWVLELCGGRACETHRTLGACRWIWR